MNPQNSHRFAEIIRTMVQDIISSRVPEAKKIDKLGKIFALYGYHAQLIGYIEACNKNMKEQEGKK